MNNLQKTGGVAALIHGAAYAVAMVWFLILLSPLLNAGPRQHMAFVADNQAIMYVGILISYWVPGATLVVMALALYERMKNGSPALMQIATVFGCIWAALIIGSGNLMLSDFGVVAKLYGNNPVQAETVWLGLDAVETGLVSGNEIVGSVWVLLLSLAALRTKGASQGAKLSWRAARCGGHPHRYPGFHPGSQRYHHGFWAGYDRVVRMGGHRHVARSPRRGGVSQQLTRNEYDCHQSNREGYKDESDCIHKIRAAGSASTQRGGKTHAQR